MWIRNLPAATIAPVSLNVNYTIPLDFTIGDDRSYEFESECRSVDHFLPSTFVGTLREPLA
jgi:hypothetical protein